MRNDLLAGLGGYLKDGDELYVSGCSAEITDLPGMLESVSLRRLTITGIFNPSVNVRSYANVNKQHRCRTFFLNAALSKSAEDGLLVFCPWTYSQIDRWVMAPGRFQAAIVMVSPPDNNGICSLGTQVDFFPSFFEKVPTIIGIINPQMPRTVGTRGIPFKSFAKTYEYEAELLGLGDDGNDDVSASIAAHIAALVPDGATIQLGIGKLPAAISQAFRDHRKLRIRSGLVTDDVLRLDDAGALDRDVPVISGVAMGSKHLYDRIENNQRLLFKPVSHTHSFAAIAETPRFFAINSALQVDLFGQTTSEMIGGRIIASPGGFSDFCRPAMKSEGGRSIVAMKAGRANSVVAMLSGAPVTCVRADADVIVTEFGIAEVRDLSLDERAEAIISIAAPADRAQLNESWISLRRGSFRSRDTKLPVARENSLSG